MDFRLNIFRLGLVFTLMLGVYCNVFDFDCRRPGSDCLNKGVCSYDNGTCLCPTSTSNYRCDQNASCPEGFYGDNCKLSRVQVFCSVTDMFVVINPYGDSEFKGEITVYERQMSPECHLKLNASAPSYVTIAAELQGYGITLYHTDNTICGNANHTDDNTTTTMTRQFVVTYDPNIRSSTDQIVTARCLLKNGVETINVVSDVTTIEDVNNGYKPVDKNASTNDVTLVVQNSDYNVLSSQSNVQLGDVIYIVIKGASYISVSNCSARDGLNTSSIDFIKDGCIDPKYKSIYEGTKKTSTSHIIGLKAFRFRGNSSNVVFSCFVTVCSKKEQCIATQCEQTTPSNKPVDTNQTSADNSTTTTTTTTTIPQFADNTTANVPETGSNSTNDGTGNRRKRASGSDGTAKVSASIKVLDGPTTSEDNSESQSAKECSTQQSYLTVVIVLAVIVAILTVSSAILIFLLTRSRSKFVAHQPNKLVQPVQTMRLPRLDLNTSSNQPF